MVDFPELLEYFSNMEIVKEKLKKIIARQNRTVAEICSNASIKHASAYNIYNGDAPRPRLDTALEFCKGLGCSIYDLTGYPNQREVHHEFIKAIIIEVEQQAKSQKTLLSDNEKSRIVHQIFQFSLEKASKDISVTLEIDNTYLEWLLSTPLGSLK